MDRELRARDPQPVNATKFCSRAVSVLGSRDVVELTERPANQLTVDHKVPMLRWTAEERTVPTSYSSMSDDDIRARFQLLKQSNGSVSHNLLKSRACERCFKSGRRGTPFGIVFFYSGGPRWAPADKKDPSGCIGCGWYDFDEWPPAPEPTPEGVIRPYRVSRYRRSVLQIYERPTHGGSPPTTGEETCIGRARDSLRETARKRGVGWGWRSVGGHLTRIPRAAYLL